MVVVIPQSSLSTSMKLYIIYSYHKISGKARGYQKHYIMGTSGGVPCDRLNNKNINDKIMYMYVDVI